MHHSFVHSCLMDGSTFFDKLLAKRGMNPTSLARAINRPTAQSGFARFKSGQIQQPKRDTLELAAKRLGVDVLAFYDEKLAAQEWARINRDAAVDDSDVDDAIDIKSRVLLPLVGEVKGGADGYLEELQYPVGHGEGVVEYPTSDPNAYALRVRGDSMHPRYRAGEFVIVEPNIEPQPGDDVVVLCTNGRKMLKQLNWRRDGEVQLLSINNGYAPLTIPMSEVESIQLATGRGRRSALKKPGHA